MAVATNFTALADKQALAKTTAALERHGFQVIVADDLRAARAEVLDIIPEGANVHTNTSRTLDDAGLTEYLNTSGKYRSNRDEFMALAGDPDKKIEMRRIGSAMEYAIGSVHAVTEDGQVLIASNSGSQLPGYAYGADHVVWVVSTKKLVADLAAGIKRIEDHVYPLEDERAKQAYGVGSVISKILIYRQDPHQRVTIILFNEDAGF